MENKQQYYITQVVLTVAYLNIVEHFATLLKLLQWTMF